MVATGARLSREDRVAAGKAARQRVPLEAHAELVLDGRDDPVALLEGQAATRVPELVPIRYGRMLTSPFAHYRGGALLMAADLARGPSSGLTVQLCGDAHASNFGVFASPERRLVFDINDFDETHPGPFDWDVKRLAASLAVAGRDGGFSAKKRRAVVLACVARYRTAMRAFARQGDLAVWYSRIEMDDVLPLVESRLDSRRAARVQSFVAKSGARDSVQALSALTTVVDGRPRIVSRPPLMVPVEELMEEAEIQATYARLEFLLRSYSRTLQRDRRHLFGQFTLVQAARKVVGVGSVGTRAWILLFEGADAKDPLFLQAKEAQPSVLAAFTSPSKLRNQGERVVAGQRLMQASSDIFLGWDRVPGPDGVERDFYLRQLRDGKGSPVVEQMVPDGMAFYGALCGHALARAHARSGDRVAIAAYLGSSGRFDAAIADYAETYAEQNERDASALADAARSGRVAVETVM